MVSGAGDLPHPPLTAGRTSYGRQPTGDLKYDDCIRQFDRCLEQGRLRETVLRKLLKQAESLWRDVAPSAYDGAAAFVRRNREQMARLEAAVEALIVRQGLLEDALEVVED
jgi:hypothetical protein